MSEFPPLVCPRCGSTDLTAVGWVEGEVKVWRDASGRLGFDPDHVYANREDWGLRPESGDTVWVKCRACNGHWFAPRKLEQGE